MANEKQVRKQYRSDLSDEQWVILEPRLPPSRTQHGGTPRRVDLRAVLDTLLYQNRTGCQWDMLPHDLLPKSTVYDYYLTTWVVRGGVIRHTYWWRDIMAKRYVVELTEEERAQLQAVGKKGKVVARRLRRAQLLLLAAEGYTDTEIAAALQVGVSTVERIRKRFVEGGSEWALTERPRPGGTPKLQGKDEAFLIATACSTPPRGRTRWTLQLLADRLVEVGVVETISDETIRRTLKKTRPSPG